MGEKKEYIDRQALIDDLIHNKSFYPVIVKNAVEDAPAVDVAPVVHGEWDVGGMSLDGVVGNWKCSVCGEVSLEDCNYCPNCGAKMDGGRGRNTCF